MDRIQKQNYSTKHLTIRKTLRKLSVRRKKRLPVNDCNLEKLKYVEVSKVWASFMLPLFIGYRYGKTLVPFSEEDKANMAYESLGNSSKSFTILAFSKQDCIKRHHFLGNGVSVVVADKAAPVRQYLPKLLRRLNQKWYQWSAVFNQGASVALSAFIHALYETNMVAIVRQVYRNKCNPKIGFLAPEIEHDHEVENLTTPTLATKNISPFKHVMLAFVSSLLFLYSV